MLSSVPKHLGQCAGTTCASWVSPASSARQHRAVRPIVRTAPPPVRRLQPALMAVVGLSAVAMVFALLVSGTGTQGGELHTLCRYVFELCALQACVDDRLRLSLLCAALLASQRCASVPVLRWLRE